MTTVSRRDEFALRIAMTMLLTNCGTREDSDPLSFKTNSVLENCLNSIHIADTMIAELDKKEAEDA